MFLSAFFNDLRLVFVKWLPASDTLRCPFCKHELVGDPSRGFVGCPNCRTTHQTEQVMDGWTATETYELKKGASI